MRGANTAEVSCPACGEPIVVSLSITMRDPEPGASVAHADVSLDDDDRSIELHAEVCAAGGGY